jgi:hypothetical protein
MHAPARSIDVDDDGVVHHAIDDGGGDDGVAEVVSEGFEVDVLCKVQFYAELPFCEL